MASNGYRLGIDFGTSTTGVAFASDGRTLASSSRDGTIRLWLPRPD